MKKIERRVKIEKTALLLNTYEFYETAAKSYAIIRASLERKGLVISERETQNAAVAVTNRLTLVTHNVREFLRIEGLMVEDWATETHKGP